MLCAPAFGQCVEVGYTVIAGEFPYDGFDHGVGAGSSAADQYPDGEAGRPGSAADGGIGMPGGIFACGQPAFGQVFLFMMEVVVQDLLWLQDLFFGAYKICR